MTHPEGWQFAIVGTIVIALVAIGIISRIHHWTIQRRCKNRLIPFKRLHRDSPVIFRASRGFLQ